MNWESAWYVWNIPFSELWRCQSSENGSIPLFSSVTIIIYIKMKHFYAYVSLCLGVDLKACFYQSLYLGLFGLCWGGSFDIKLSGGLGWDSLIVSGSARFPPLHGSSCAPPFYWFCLRGQPVKGKFFLATNGLSLWTFALGPVSHFFECLCEKGVLR